ncbi:MAG: lysophospholipid acyltransferase family protein [Alphaproteobacteria bacterium]
MIKLLKNLLKKARYFLESVGFTCIILVYKVLPLPWASSLGGGIAKLAGPFLGASRTASKNLRRIFPEKTEAELGIILGGMWDNFGRVVAEYMHSAHILRHMKGLKSGQRPYLCVEGREVLEKLQESGKAAIFFTGHLGNWQMATLAAKLQGISMLQVYRAANNKWVDAAMRYFQREAVSDVLTKSSAGARMMRKALLEKKHVFVLADQKMNNGMEVPFMGYPSMTASGIGKLAQRLDCCLIPVQVVRLEGVFFKVIFHPPLSLEGDLNALMLRVNASIEGWVRQHPEQWFWVHNRWDF